MDLSAPEETLTKVQTPGWRQLPNPNRRPKPLRSPSTVSLPAEMLARSVRFLVQQKQFASAATVARTSVSMFNAAIPELYQLIDLDSPRAVYRFLWTHAKLAIPTGPESHHVTEDYSSGRRAARARAYHSVIQHVDINIGPTSNVQTQPWWSREYAKFPRLAPDHASMKIWSVHITTISRKASRAWDREWITGTLTMFQARHLRYIYRGWPYRGQPDGLERLGQMWDMDHLQSLDLPCILDHIPISKLRWTRPQSHVDHRSSLWWLVSDLRRLSGQSGVDFSTTTDLPACILFNPIPDEVILFKQWLQGFSHDEKETARLMKVFHFANDKEVSQMTSEDWRQWLKKDYWGERD